MRLQDKQAIFASYVGKLIVYINEQGYEVTFGDAWAFDVRPVIEYLQSVGGAEDLIKLLISRKHSKHSKHYKKLGIDLNIFRDGKYLSKTEDHRPFGEYWESLDHKCVWGGRIKDGNHYQYGHTF